MEIFYNINWSLLFLDFSIYCAFLITVYLTGKYFGKGFHSSLPDAKISFAHSGFSIEVKVDGKKVGEAIKIIQKGLKEGSDGR